MSGHSHGQPVDVSEPAEGRWVAVAWAGGELVAVGPLPNQTASIALLGQAEAHIGVEQVGVAELVDPEEAAARLARVRPKGAAAAGVLRAVPRQGQPARQASNPKATLVEVAGNTATLHSPCHGAEQMYPRDRAVAGAWLKAVCGVCGTTRVVEVQADETAESGLRACWTDTDTAAGGEGGR